MSARPALNETGRLRLARAELEGLAAEWHGGLWERPTVRSAHRGQPATADAADAVTDRPDLVPHVRALLLPGEFLHAVLGLKGRGPGFAAVTSSRVLLYDRAARAVVSLPFARVLAVALRDEGGQFAQRGLAASATLVLTAAHGAFDLPFQSSAKAHLAHELILRYLL